MMADKLHLSSSPHIHAKKTVRGIMLDVIIALIPATVAGAVIFGIKSLLVVAVCVITCLLAEFLFNLIVKREQTIGDLSAVVTGLILALNLPADLPVWQAVVGSLFAIIIVKCFFGGIGCNLVNPAATARVFMIIAFGTTMTKASFPIDAASSATPLANLLNEGSVANLTDLLIGNHGGSIGETCAIALIIGGIYLLIRRVITWHIPVTYIGVVFLMFLFIEGFNIEIAAAQVLTGGLLIGAIFMATDYVTSPSTPLGKVVFGAILGVMTVVLRILCKTECVSYVILLGNIISPYISILTANKIFGGKKYEKSA